MDCSLPRKVVSAVYLPLVWSANRADPHLNQKAKALEATLHDNFNKTVVLLLWAA